MASQYPFWNNELTTLSSLINGVAPDFSICITGVPSYERNYAVELILKEKELDYCLISCSSRSNVRSVLYDVCLQLAQQLNLPYTFKSTGELLLDIQEYSKEYFINRDSKKSFYCVFDGCENLDSESFDLINKLASKVSHLGVILLTISLDSYRVISSFIIHLPVTSDNELESVLLSDCNKSPIARPIVLYIIRYFAVQTHSISELKTLRDMALAYCQDHSITDEKGIERCIQTLQQSLFVNIMPIYTDRMESVLDPQGTIPLSDFCGVDISYNAKLLLIASYLCSIYPESEDCKLFGRDDKLHVKTKGRKKRRETTAVMAMKPSYFSIHRLVALYNTIKQTIFPELHSASSNYGLVLQQINVLTQLGLLAHVGGQNHTIDLNQVLYRCCVNRMNIINIAKNIQFDILPYICICLFNKEIYIAFRPNCP